jgi:anti-sigma regulatory factor (Ser/Thr protein kinase)
MYSSGEEFVSAAVPFIQAGIARSEPVFVVTNPPKLALVRDALGDAAEGVSFGDHANWYDVPARRLNEFYRLYRQWQRAGVSRIRVIGEPVWTDCSDAQVHEWKRFESLANLAYAGLPVLALCPYDTHALPPSVVADAYRTHPEVLSGSKREPSLQFIDPAAFSRELDCRELPEPEVPQSQLSFRGDLDGLRWFVVDQATQAGVGGTKLAELEWAANEIATNVVRHAGGEARVRTWSAPGEFVCEIADRGPGIKDPLVGRLPPDLDQELGSGLWVVHQLCDLVEVRSSTSGLRARLHVLFDQTG